jgi:ATP-binding cassette, subfamily B, bacterial
VSNSAQRKAEKVTAAHIRTDWRAAWRGFLTLLWFAFRANPVLVTFVFVMESVSQVLELLSIYAVKWLVDAAVSGSVNAALMAAVAIAAARAADLVCSRLFHSSREMLRESTLLLVDQRMMEIAGGAIGLDHEERPDYANQMALLRADRELLGWATESIVKNVRVAIQVVGSAAILATLHPVLALLPLLGIPPFLAAKRGTDIAQRTAEATAERQRTWGHLFTRATTADAGKELRLFGLADVLIGRHNRLTDEVVRLKERASWQGAALDVAGTVCFAGGYVAAIGLVLWRAMNGQATAGDVVLGISLAAQMSAQVAKAVAFGNITLKAIRAAGRYLWLVEYEAAARRAWPDLAPARVPATLSDGITLENLSFAYPGTQKEILRDVSVHLPAGSVVALVGENGAGKTTLVKLLEQFYDPTAGRILLDGVDLHRLDTAEWRARTTAAFQDFRKFEFVVQETVGVGSLAQMGDATAVRSALAEAGGEDLIELLPHDMATQLGKSWEGGVDLSGGQWQKLALGRAFMRQDPLLVFFDEPTAAIDAQTEHALFVRFAAAARSGASRGTVTLIVSHRFSTVRMADLILVLDGGRVVEQGSHEALIRSGGMYAELYDLQAAAYR